MNVKDYFFRMVIGTAACALGIGIYFIWQSFPSAQTDLAIPVTIKPVTAASPIFAPLPPAVDTVALENVAIEDEFYPAGDYYLIGDSPKDFKDIESLSISTDKWDEKLEKLIPVVPTGYVLAGKEFKFVQIALNNRQLSFRTATVNGISYEFTGNYPKEEISLNDGEDYVALRGRLIKFKDGKKVAEIEANFGVIDGC